MTILDFIEARLREWEDWARAASAADRGEQLRSGKTEHWRWEYPAGGVVVPDLSQHRIEIPDGTRLRSREVYSFGQPSELLRSCWLQNGPAGHIIRNDPAQVVLLVAAFRLLVDEALDSAAHWDRDFGCAVGHGVAAIRAGECEYLPLHHIPELRIIAGAWREHPDWAEEWVPEAVKNLGESSG